MIDKDIQRDRQGIFIVSIYGVLSVIDPNTLFFYRKIDGKNYRYRLIKKIIDMDRQYFIGNGSKHTLLTQIDRKMIDKDLYIIYYIQRQT